MNDYRRVIKDIKHLEFMISSSSPGAKNRRDFKEIWDQIKATQNAFNDSRFPTRQER